MIYMEYFKLELTKSQIETILALLNIEHKIKGYHTLRDLGREAQLDYQGCLYRQKDWLLEHEILIEKDGKYKVDYQAIANLLFDKTHFDLVYRFAYRHLEFSL